ncbi:uncharacterized protein [Prorops nasuta]|uniref:uncharacterized protein n=1 Tax=Prorops nasuta TaxID=863751 RepID=UPI0034CF40C7
MAKRILNYAKLYFQKTSGLDKILNEISKILHNSTPEELLQHDLNILFTPIIKELFQHNEKYYDKENTHRWEINRKLHRVHACYYELLKTFIPINKKRVVTTVLDIIDKNQLWHFETLCFEVFNELLTMGIDGATVVNVIYDKINSKNIKTENVRFMIRILYNILDIYKWPETVETKETVERTLRLFYTSIVNKDDPDILAGIAIFKRGLQVCVRNTVKNLPNDHLLLIIEYMCSWAVLNSNNNNIILEFGSVLEYTARLYKAGLYETTLNKNIFPLLMKMIASSNKTVNLLGNRVIQYLIDREENRTTFDTPKIFFQNKNFDLKLSSYRREDKQFLKAHREILHDSLLKSLLKHASSRVNLETTYCTICLIAIQVPCGFTAAAVVCLLMNAQDIILDETNSNRPLVLYHIHAVIISIMSLLCWIHDAKVFYNYVNSIIMERAQWAPHLNPPLQAQYSFAIHHVAYNKPELFFVDWEVRYGLWKCFRLLET